MILILAVIVSLIVIIAILYCVFVHRQYDYFKRLNIPGPQPSFFFGNLFDLTHHGITESECLCRWTKEYGPIFGFFKGHTPYICTSDVDLLSNVFVKQFSKFHSRQSLPLDERKSAYVHIVHAEGQRWRRQRKVVNPVFSKTKVKSMQALMTDCVKTFMMRVDAHGEKQAFDILPFYQRLTMDIFWTCGFGMETNMQSDYNNEFFKYSNEVFEIDDKKRILGYLSILIPEFHGLFRFVHWKFNMLKYLLQEYMPLVKYFQLKQDPIIWITLRTDDIIKERLNQKDSTKPRNDLLQILLNSLSENEKEINDQQCPMFDSMDEATSTDQRNKLTLAEIQANIFIFMAAGYETSATTLGFITYILATHPDEQNRLSRLLAETFPNICSDDNSIDYDLLNNLEYLDWFIKETLRMYPIGQALLDRQLYDESFEIEHYGPIKKGTIIMGDMHSIHHDPELWGPHDPELFYPERFEDKRHSMAFLAFGQGPRNCIGMRFAMMEIKLLLVHLLSRFTIIKTVETESNFKIVEQFVTKPQAIWIKIQHKSG